ncbi:MAG: peptide ABC transporter [Anaerolinea sp.]|nr:peptide ABC transporter [Anaerolinea sp.]
MTAYLVRRGLQTIPLLLLVTFLTFSLLLFLPGDPVTSLLSQGETLDPEIVEAYRKELHLDEPIPVQYGYWLRRAMVGDFGDSTQTRKPVSEELRSRIPATLQIGLAGFVAGLLIGVPAGIAAAVWHNTVIDRVVTMFSVAGVAVPGFWFGIMLILLFSVKLRWLPALGFERITSNPGEALKLMILPVTVIGWELSAVVTRQLRSSMLEVLRQDYIRTARAKGLHERRVVWLHGLRNALLPVVTVLGLLLGRILAGAVVVETIFAIPGVGRLLVGSVRTNDFPVVQAIVLMVALSVVFMNIVTDVVYAALDPRIRYS